MEKNDRIDIITEYMESINEAIVYLYQEIDNIFLKLEAIHRDIQQQGE